MNKLRLARTTLRVHESADLDGIRGALPTNPAGTAPRSDGPDVCHETDSCQCLTTIRRTKFDGSLVFRP
jgi:hypothetical protein